MAHLHSSDAYHAGLKMLARRELSAAQVRERLTRKAFAPDQVEQAIRRLRSEGAIDDRRTAGAYARQAVQIKLRGQKRTLRELGALGISPAVAHEVVREAYAAVDETALVERALSKRLHGRVETRAQFRRLYHALLRQGFESRAIVATLMPKTDLSAQPRDDQAADLEPTSVKR